ncbi:MAG: hypothetical protein K5896_13880 [Prevotella sp.]|nr:hypothetical protein [Prevotella sp.]
MKSIKNIFRKKQNPNPLRIEGIADAPMTPEPDDAELAAMALLEKMAEIKGVSRNDSITARDAGGEKNAARDAAYYKKLAERIRSAHESAGLRTQRFLAFCEQELGKPDLPKEGPGSLGLLEAELYKRIDVVNRHGGELRRRWQYCLAMVTVRLMDGLPPVGEEEA